MSTAEYRGIRALKDDKTGKMFWADKDIHRQQLVQEKKELRDELTECGKERNRLIQKMMEYREEHGRTSTPIAAAMATLHTREKAVNKRLGAVAKKLRQLLRTGKPTLGLQHNPLNIPALAELRNKLSSAKADEQHNQVATA